MLFRVFCLWGFELFRTPEIGDADGNKGNSWEIRQGPCDDPRMNGGDGSEEGTNG